MGKNKKKIEKKKKNIKKEKKNIVTVLPCVIIFDVLRGLQIDKMQE